MLVILSIAKYCQLVLLVYSQYCQLVLGGFSQYCQVLSSCVGASPSIVSTRSCRQNTEERSAETLQTQTMANTETKIKTNIKTMTRTKIKTETKTDTGRSTGTRGGRSLSAGQGLSEFVRNYVFKIGTFLSDMLCLSYYGDIGTCCCVLQCRRLFYYGKVSKYVRLDSEIGHNFQAYDCMPEN